MPYPTTLKSVTCGNLNVHAMKISKIWAKALGMGFSFSLLAGCGPSEEATVYETPKETEIAPASPAVAPQPTSMQNQTLPSSALNQTEGNPEWAVPEGWQSVEASAMRRASFLVPGSGGPADLSVTSFPGDVGGLLANVNRWSQQIGLNPVSESDLASLTETVTAGNKSATLVVLEGSPQSTLAGIFMHNSNSWFFKLTGPQPTILEQEAAFRSFVSSVRFP